MLSPKPSRRTVFSLVVVLCVACLLLLSTAVEPPQRVGAAVPSDERDSLVLLPDIQSKTETKCQVLAPTGQEGFGESEVDIQNLAGTDNPVTLALGAKVGSRAATVQRSLGPLGVARVVVKDEATVQIGYYAGRLSGPLPLAGIARVRWVSGAAVAYEAIPPSRELILPLVARLVYGHTTVFFAQNADTTQPRNIVNVRLYDPLDASILVETETRIPSGATELWSTVDDKKIFGPDVVGSNTATGGWLGSVWFQAEQPISVLAYGDETTAAGSSAYIARAVADADTLQYLPQVRANYLGDSLIAVANATAGKVSVTIEYHGAAFSPIGAGQTYTQSFDIEARGSAFVDLSTRKRGTRPTPNLPRGSGNNAGFIGSATIRSSGPVLAVVQEEQLLADRTVDTVAAYNAFGPRDLGTVFSAPTVRRGLDNLTTTLALYNPGDADLPVTVDMLAVQGPSGAQRIVAVPASSLAQVTLQDVAELRNGLYSARLSAERPFAALIVDSRSGSGHVLGAPARTNAANSVDAVIAAAVRLTGGSVEATPSVPPPSATTTPVGSTATATSRPPTATATPTRATVTATASPTPTDAEHWWVYLPLAKQRQ
jgi:hypothetical protein